MSDVIYPYPYQETHPTFETFTEELAYRIRQVRAARASGASAKNRAAWDRWFVDFLIGSELDADMLQDAYEQRFNQAEHYLTMHEDWHEMLGLAEPFAHWYERLDEALARDGLIPRGDPTLRAFHQSYAAVINTCLVGLSDLARLFEWYTRAVKRPVRAGFRRIILQQARVVDYNRHGVVAFASGSVDADEFRLLADARTPVTVVVRIEGEQKNKGIIP